MRILCIGDSLALPREGCPYECTWFYKLQCQYPDIHFIDYFKRGLILKETTELFNMYYSEYNPDIVIIQTGICDCAPRIINYYRLGWNLIFKIAGRLRISNILWKVVKKIYSRDSDCVYTKQSDFFLLYENLLKRFLNINVKKILIVKIGHSSETVLNSNPQFNNNVDIYNNIIEEIAKKYQGSVELIDPLNAVYDDCFVDGYHCNSKGMEMVFEKIKEKIEIWRQI